MAKHILDLHRTILFTRLRHPGHVAAGALAFALAPAFWPSDAAAHTCDAPFRTDLVTARGIDVGQVAVCNDAEFLTVTYETKFPWCVLRTNLHVASNLAGIPKIRLLGTPNFLRFDFIEEVDCEGEVTFDIPLDEIGGGALPGDRVVVAARAVVEGEGDDGTHPRCLLGDKCVAWGEGSRFRPRLPAMYFTYEVQEAITCGDGSKCVFVSSTLHTGNLGGLTGADAICNDLAGAAGLPGAGSYLAWLSDSSASPSTRFTQATVPYRRVDGTQVADNWIELTDGTGNLDVEISVDEGGGIPDLDFVWTGTHALGVAQFPLLACSDWTSSSVDEIGQVGSSLANDFRWTEPAGLIPCGELAHLYCFQQ